MDEIKKLADKLSEKRPQPKAVKSARTISLNHHSYLLLMAYCRRKELILGDLVSDLIQILIDALIANGEITKEDQDNADSADRVKEERESRKDNIKKVG